MSDAFLVDSVDSRYDCN